MAKVTVVEWFDPECESCRKFHPVFMKIVSSYKDRVHFVLRYMPYHPSSKLAASAIEEARELGKFEEALDTLFAHQPEWGDHHEPRPDLIPGYLIKIGIPKERLNPEALVKKHGEKIEIDAKDGEAVGVRGTPSLFVNGAPVQGLSEETVRAAIDSELK